MRSSWLCFSWRSSSKGSCGWVCRCGSGPRGGDRGGELGGGPGGGRNGPKEAATRGPFGWLPGASNNPPEAARGAGETLAAPKVLRAWSSARWCLEMAVES